jgi:hypothetical protein
MNRNRIWQQEPAQEGKRESFGIAEHKMFIYMENCLFPEFF